MTIIGISGKIGSGKNYLSEKLIQEFTRLGYTTSEASFAAALRNELNRIIKTIKVDYLDAVPFKETIHNMADIYNMTVGESALMHALLIDDIVEHSDLNANSRTEGIRRSLQILGTDIRRKTDNDYWVKEFLRTVPESDFVFVTDVRFPNEADAIVNSNGVMLRLEVPQEVINERVQGRDGLQYSEDALNHPSELALDDYEQFNITVDDQFIVHDIVELIINKDDRFVRIEQQGV